MSIAEALRASRKAARLTQVQLAETLGTAQSTIAEIEKGRIELARKHIPNLPNPIRRKVIEAAIAELKAMK
jgi:transcriptional regulator with XRE-family HTH domain